MGLFGWSYPPGCSGPPEEPEPHPKYVEAWEIMESAGVDESVIEKVCGIIGELAIAADRECPQCLKAWAMAEQKAIEQFESTKRSDVAD